MIEITVYVMTSENGADGGVHVETGGTNEDIEVQTIEILKHTPTIKHRMKITPCKFESNIKRQISVTEDQVTHNYTFYTYTHPDYIGPNDIITNPKIKAYKTELLKEEIKEAAGIKNE